MGTSVSSAVLYRCPAVFDVTDWTTDLDRTLAVAILRSAAAATRLYRLYDGASLCDRTVVSLASLCATALALPVCHDLDGAAPHVDDSLCCGDGVGTGTASRTATDLVVHLGRVDPHARSGFGKTQVFDDERLLMPVFPFLAALAGIGFGAAIQAVRQFAQQRAHPAWAMPAIAVLVGLAFIPQSLFAYDLYPHLLSYYSEGLGGLPGAARTVLSTPIGLRHTRMPWHT